MPNPDILTEIPPISGQDCFVVFDRYKREFCFPVHIHKEYELNLSLIHISEPTRH